MRPDACRVACNNADVLHKFLCRIPYNKVYRRGGLTHNRVLLADEYVRKWTRCRQDSSLSVQDEPLSELARKHRALYKAALFTMIHRDEKKQESLKNIKHDKGEVTQQ